LYWNRVMRSHRSHNGRQSLSPEELRAVVDAFETGLSAAATATPGLGPHEFRQRLAKLLIERAFDGEPDLRRLKVDAIHFAERTGGNAK
jgi:hypothetical protein